MKCSFKRTFQNKLQKDFVFHELTNPPSTNLKPPGQQSRAPAQAGLPGPSELKAQRAARPTRPPAADLRRSAACGVAIQTPRGRHSRTPARGNFEPPGAGGSLTGRRRLIPAGGGSAWRPGRAAAGHRGAAAAAGSSSSAAAGMRLLREAPTQRPARLGCGSVARGRAARVLLPCDTGRDCRRAPRSGGRASRAPPLSSRPPAGAHCSGAAKPARRARGGGRREAVRERAASRGPPGISLH